MTRSNPKPVEGARELLVRLRTPYGAQGLLLEINAEMRELIGKFTGMDFSNPADIYLAMRHLEEFLNRQNNRHADALEAALSAAPAPTAIPTVDEIAEAMADARLWKGSWTKMCEAERNVMRQGAEGVYSLLERCAAKEQADGQR